MTIPPFITVVSGLPRSGTSMIMQMLCAGGLTPLTDGARVADPDNPRGYFELEAVKRTRNDASWVAQARGKVVKVIHLLLTDLPENEDYRVIFVRRKIEEVVASQRAMLARQGKPGAAVQQSVLARTFEDQLRRTDAWLRERSRFAVLNVDHGDVLRDPLSAAREINTFLGGTLNEQAMATVVEGALHRQRL